MKTDTTDCILGKTETPLKGSGASVPVVSELFLTTEVRASRLCFNRVRSCSEVYVAPAEIAYSAVIAARIT